MKSYPNIVVFGRGIGECILVELAEDQWMIVDSFRHPTTQQPVSLDYLRSKEISNESVSHIVMTHSHKDHIAGMCEVIKACPKAEIYISDAFACAETIKYYHNENQRLGSQLSGAGEYLSILDFLDKSSRMIIPVKADTVIYDDDGIRISAISPSNSTVHTSRTDFAKWLDKHLSGLTPSIPKRNPNNSSVVLAIEDKINNEYLILGADLEVTPENTAGWDAAIKAHMAPKSKDVSYFKISHHGSENGYHKQTWDSLVKEDALAVLTTFSNSSLPRKEIIDLYRKHTTRIFSTTKPKYVSSLVLSKKSQEIATSLEKMPTIKQLTPASAFGYVSTCYKSGVYDVIELHQDATRL